MSFAFQIAIMTTTLIGLMWGRLFDGGCGGDGEATGGDRETIELERGEFHGHRSYR